MIKTGGVESLGTRLCLPPGRMPSTTSASVYTANRLFFVGFTVYPWCAVAHHAGLPILACHSILVGNGTSVALQNRIAVSSNSLMHVKDACPTAIILT